MIVHFFSFMHTLFYHLPFYSIFYNAEIILLAFISVNTTGCCLLYCLTKGRFYETSRKLTRAPAAWQGSLVLSPVSGPWMTLPAR